MKIILLAILILLSITFPLQADIIIIYKCKSTSGYCAARFHTTKNCNDFELDTTIVKDCIDLPRGYSLFNLEKLDNDIYLAFATAPIHTDTYIILKNH